MLREPRRAEFLPPGWTKVHPTARTRSGSGTRPQPRLRQVRATLGTTGRTVYCNENATASIFLPRAIRQGRGHLSNGAKREIFSPTGGGCELASFPARRAVTATGCAVPSSLRTGAQTSPVSVTALARPDCEPNRHESPGRCNDHRGRARRHADRQNQPSRYQLPPRHTRPRPTLHSGSTTAST